ncbi:hypothetical protein Ga0074812_108117 [Parafrankia irregularis]|uniref:Uncharacterized protein n=1 Tax=Parafrankia irregularis TaxID=795642 RepID=A0A0S4QM92_9ACTN|nr:MULTISPECIES: hypothetical protein [Parafrankia]MBE3200218.1 hypothetical protein [Parafrankia sp. CH37]CUU56589.1 hypothetical protein Ga0074812_108117 [Parafrankia irregularis]
MVNNDASQPGQRPPGTAHVEIQVPAGGWRFRRSPGNTGRITAELVIRGENPADRISVYGAESTPWGIETQLGFPIPATVREALRLIPPAATNPGLRISAPAPWIGASDYQPTRASMVHLPDTFNVFTYGTLLHIKPPIRTWEEGPYRIDVVGTELTFENRDSPTLQVAYRIWHDQRVVFASGDLPVPIGSGIQADATLRSIADHALTAGTGREPTDLQREFLAKHSAELRSVLTPPTAPYPIGTRVKVRGLAGATPASGIITDAIVDDDGSLHYGWRPDVARLPGHPMGQHLDQQLVAPAQNVQPTLHSPDAGLSSTQEAEVLVYGARVRAIDDPRFATGTVLRAILKPGGQPTYDIQPDQSSYAPIRIHAADVEPIAGTAWPTLQALLDARADAGISLESGELLITLREATFVRDGPTGPLPAFPPQEWPSQDPILDPESPDIPISAPPHRGHPTPTPAPRIVIEDDYTRVYDPRHELLIAHKQPFEIAISQPREKLVELLNTLPDLHLGGDESLVTLAALAAQHMPDEVNSIFTAGPVADTRNPGQVPAADPDFDDIHPPSAGDTEPPDIDLDL